MIRRFRHKGLGDFFRTGSRAGILAAHAERLRLVLAILNAAATPGDVAIPGLRLHSLKGIRTGTWSVSISANWRVTFRFEDSDATDVDYEDYH